MNRPMRRLLHEADHVFFQSAFCLLAADTFGRERVGVVFGWIFAAHQFGAAAAAWAAGATRGWLGSYTFAFVSAGAPCLLAALLVTRISLPLMLIFVNSDIKPSARCDAASHHGLSNLTIGYRGPSNGDLS